jgi:TolB-like protein/Tfp pilus assembly protein PilF
VSLFAELKRLNVFRVGIAYAVVAWLLLQVTDIIAPLLVLPDWAPKLILVILVVGFVPALIFAWAYELTPEGLKKDEDVDRSESISSIALDTPGLAENSIAGLPFVNMIADEDQEYFSDGITEEILNSLTGVKELKVCGRTSSFAFKGQNQDLRRIGDSLSVAHILEGSVRKSGTTVRITAQLVQVADGFHLWSQTYDRELTDVFAIQDEIATEILNQLKAKLLDGEHQVLVSQQTDPEVYELYLLARQRLYSRTHQSMESATTLLDQAIAKDPDYAPAYALLGIVTLFLSEFSLGTIPHAEADKRGKGHIDRALKLDPQLAEAWAGLGLYHYGRPREHEQAKEALTMALSINPNLIDASLWLHHTLGACGEVRQALQLIENVTERDPLYGPGFANAVQDFNKFGMADRAQALIDRFRSYEVHNEMLLQADAWHHYYAGDLAEGLRLAEQGYQLAPTNAVSHTAFQFGLVFTYQNERIVETGTDYFKVSALHLLGRRDEALALALKTASDGYLDNLFPLYNRADLSQQLVDYLEERWPSLSAFAADYPRDQNGYSLMVDVALAYSRVGNAERFKDALTRAGDAVSDLSKQGVDNRFFSGHRARYLALAGEYDDATRLLEDVTDKGNLTYVPFLTDPVFEPLSDDPRFTDLKLRVVDNLNVVREELGLDPFEASAEFWQ